MLGYSITMCLVKFGFAFILLVSSASSFAQSNFFLLPPSWLSYQNGSTIIDYKGKTLNFDLIQGWKNDAPLTGNFHDHIHLDGNSIYISQDVVNYLGSDIAKLASVYGAENSSLRIVFEFEGEIDLNRYIQTGSLVTGERLDLELPPFLVPWGISKELLGVSLGLIAGFENNQLSLTVPKPMRYRIFSFYAPLRLVIDLTPINEELKSEEGFKQSTPPSPLSSPNTSFTLEKQKLESPELLNFSLLSRLTERKSELRAGVTYRRFVYPTGGSLSMVHLLEISPYAGEFRVVGEPKVPQTISELAIGGFAAINANYFDPKTFTNIGFLRLDYQMLSEPSRNRASIAFDRNRAVIDRVYYQARVMLKDSYYFPNAPYQGGEITIYTRAGESFGTPERGTIVVAGNTVLENTIGPRTIPQGGFVISYEITPNLLGLTSIKPGDYARLDTDIFPRTFMELRYAVEAGPLLVYEGQSAYDPSKEHFQNAYIVNGRTLQAAVGIKADGTVLLLTASSMNAEELVPLFLSLKAQTAMRLDSGSSTSLFAGGQLLNRKNERRIVNAIVFFPY